MNAGHRGKPVQILDDSPGAYVEDHELPGAHVRDEQPPGRQSLARARECERNECEHEHQLSPPYGVSAAPFSTKPTSPAATMITGSGIFLGASRSAKVTSAMTIVGRSKSDC